MKRIIFTLIIISLVGLVSAINYQNIDLVLDGINTDNSYLNIDLVLGEAPTDSCTCPGLATNWEIDLSDYCNITTNCNISTGNITFINTGYVLFNATLTAYEINWNDSVGIVEEYNLGNNFKGWVG